MEQKQYLRKLRKGLAVVITCTVDEQEDGDAIQIKQVEIAEGTILDLIEYFNSEAHQRLVEHIKFPNLWQ